MRVSWLYDTNGQVDWRWIVTATVAAYAAAVATYREVAARKERLAHVQVMLYTNIVMIDGASSVPHVQVRVENHGKPDLTFDSNCISVEWRGNDNVQLLLWDCVRSVTVWPHRLSSGSSFYFMAPTEGLRDFFRGQNVYQNVEIRAVVSDAIGRKFFSEWGKLPQVH